MVVSKFELFSALLNSSECSESVTNLMHYLEDNMTKAGGVVIELEEVL